MPRSALCQLLAESELFEGAPEADLDRIAAVAMERRYAAGEMVFARGEPAKALYAVVDGQLRAVVAGSDGREITLRMLDAGSVFGEIGLLDGGRRTATVVAQRPSRIARIERKALLDQLRAHPEVSLNLLAVLASRLRASTEQLEETNLFLLPARVARRLLALADEYGAEGDGGVEVRISQEEFGQLVATSRVSINQQLKAWEAEGLVGLRRGHVVVVDRAALEAIAAAG